MHEHDSLTGLSVPSLVVIRGEEEVTFHFQSPSSLSLVWFMNSRI